MIIALLLIIVIMMMAQWYPGFLNFIGWCFIVAFAGLVLLIWLS